MTPNNRDLGTMRPIGGGDPIPLKKSTLTIGRRPSCDIRLDFDNISGRHCELKFVSGVWHVRDLNSTNGTTVNGQRISNNHGLMPDDNLGIAGRYYRIDYNPESPSSLREANLLIEEELAEEMGESRTQRRSLMELAGLTKEEDQFESRRRRPSSSAGAAPVEGAGIVKNLNSQALSSSHSEEPSGGESETPGVELSDDDFLNLIREDLQK